MLGKDTFEKSLADQLLYAAGIINSSKKKEISGLDVFSQVIPKGANISIPAVITGSNTFGAEDGAMVKVIDKELGRDAAVDSIFKAFTLGTAYLTNKGHTLSVVWGPLTVSKLIPDALKAKTGNRLSCIKRIIDSTPGLLFLIFTADAVLSAGVPVRFRYCGETSWVESNTFDVSLGPVSERIVEVTVPRSIDHIVVTSEVTDEQRAINFWWPEVWG